LAATFLLPGLETRDSSHSQLCLWALCKQRPRETSRRAQSVKRFKAVDKKAKEKSIYTNTHTKTHTCAEGFNVCIETRRSLSLDWQLSYLGLDHYFTLLTKLQQQQQTNKQQQQQHTQEEKGSGSFRFLIPLGQAQLATAKVANNQQKKNKTKKKLKQKKSKEVKRRGSVRGVL